MLRFQFHISPNSNWIWWFVSYGCSYKCISLHDRFQSEHQKIENWRKIFGLLYAVKFGLRYSRMDQVNLWKRVFKKLGRPYHFKFLKGCLPQILLGPLLNTLYQIFRYVAFLPKSKIVKVLFLPRKSKFLLIFPLFPVINFFWTLDWNWRPEEWF